MTYPSEKLIVKLKRRERFIGHAYPDPASALGRELRAKKLWSKVLADAAFADSFASREKEGTPWTYGYGVTENVRPGMRISADAADDQLREKLDFYINGVNSATPKTSQNEFDAMLSLTWNIGVEAFKRSSIAKAHNRGDKFAAAKAFELYNMANGKVEPGLIVRRKEEALDYLTPDAGQVETPPLPMPQKVDAESSLVKSPIIGGAALAGVSSVLSVAADAAKSLASVRESLGSWLPYALVAVTLFGVAVVVYQRIKQRRKGWA